MVLPGREGKKAFVCGGHTDGAIRVWDSQVPSLSFVLSFPPLTGGGHGQTGDQVTPFGESTPQENVRCLVWVEEDNDRRSPAKDSHSRSTLWTGSRDGPLNVWKLENE